MVTPSDGVVLQQVPTNLDDVRIIRRDLKGMIAWVRWTGRNFDAGRSHHAAVVWTITVVGPALLVGAIAGFLLALTRWQAVHLLPAEWYYRMLTAHGLNMLIFFIIFFEMAVLYFASSTLLNTRLAAPRIACSSASGSRPSPRRYAPRN